MSAPSRRPSMADVARRAGVSIQTVSRVLNEPELVRESTREAVTAAIADLGYMRNRAARALKTTRSSLIGVLTDGTGLFGPIETTTAIEAAAREAGYAVLLTTARPGDEGRAVGAELHGSGADGIVVIAGHDAMLPAVEAVARTTPVLAVTAEPSDLPGVRTVGVDQRAGARQVVEHLRERGRGRIAHLAGPEDWADARARRDGVLEALEATGIDGEVLAGGDWTPASGAAMTERLLAAGRPDAIFAANDLMAMGVLHTLARHGLRVPEDVAVVGFDDVIGAGYLRPGLTTVAQPFSGLGHEALTQLVAAVEGGAPAEVPQALAPTLVVRGSTDPAA